MQHYIKIENDYFPVSYLDWLDCSAIGFDNVCQISCQILTGLTDFISIEDKEDNAQRTDFRTCPGK